MWGFVALPEVASPRSKAKARATSTTPHLPTTADMGHLQDGECERLLLHLHLVSLHCLVRPAARMPGDVRGGFHTITPIAPMVHSEGRFCTIEI
jgi:hypothetical protein